LGWAAEGHDAGSISFNDAQRQLINQAAAAAKRPVIVVVFTATPLDLSEILANPKVGAVLHVGQPSVQTLGIGDLIFGLKVPAGKTIQTVLPSSYADQISIFDFNMRPGPSAWPRPDCKGTNCPNGTNPGRTYRFYTGKPVVPFGFGLSYTTFNYAIVEAPTQISLSSVRQVLAETSAQGRLFVPLEKLSAPLTKYVINVTNTGMYDADNVLLGFIVPPGAGTNGTPLQYLYGFERVHVPKGKTVTVFLYPSIGDFTQVDSTGKRVPVSGQYIVQFGIPETSKQGQGFAVHKVYAA